MFVVWKRPTFFALFFDLWVHKFFGCFKTANEQNFQFSLFNACQYKIQIQIACICKTLYLNREGEKLNQFFESQQQARQLCDPIHFFNNNNEVNSHDLAAAFCAYLFALYHRGNYEELFERVRYSKLDVSYHAELQKIWYEAHYAEDQEKKTKKLGPVDKYRIRHKFPPPASVSEKIILKVV